MAGRYARRTAPPTFADTGREPEVLSGLGLALEAFGSSNLSITWGVRTHRPRVRFTGEWKSGSLDGEGRWNQRLSTPDGRSNDILSIRTPSSTASPGRASSRGSRSEISTP